VRPPPRPEDWVPSPMTGVHRYLLDRVGGEIARATSLVRYAAGSRFSRHEHGGGEEILVLEGVFSDERGDHPAGTYLRNPPGSGHAPFSLEGCTLFVKLWQFARGDLRTVRTDTRSADWHPGLVPGLTVMPLHEFAGISTALVLNSGMMADDDQYMVRHELERSILDDMHAPIAYFIGGESDIAHPNAEQDWQALQKLDLAAINANMDVGHGATYQMPNGGPFASGPLAWLEWQLKGDAEARAMFVGEACDFCSGSDWTLRRHFPQ